jgi:hypothetical protein
VEIQILPERYGKRKCFLQDILLPSGATFGRINCPHIIRRKSASSPQ